MHDPAEFTMAGGSALGHGDAAGDPAASLRLDRRHNTASAILTAGAG